MRFGFCDCELDTDTRELRRGGATVPLEPKAYQVLCFLVAQRHRVVTRDELLAHAWPGVIVVDTTLSRCLALIRKAVGDSAAEQRVVRTQQRHGYRFVAEVVEGGPMPPAAVAPPPAADDATIDPPQRQPVSVLCGLLAPDFALVPGAEAETQQAMAERLEATIRHAIAPYDGHLMSLASDRFAVVFGMPQAQEDHAERAVLAALALRHEWVGLESAWSAILGLPIALGLGVHSGTVVVQRGGEAAATFHGDVLSLAERIAGHGFGRLLLSAASAPLAAAVTRFGETVSIALPERREPLLAMPVEGAIGPQPPGRPLGLRHHGPFVGRQADLAALRAEFGHAQDGHGRSVAVVGPPGMGKTRIVAEFVRSLSDGAATVLHGRCQSHAQHTAYGPLIDLLADWEGRPREPPGPLDELLGLATPEPDMPPAERRARCFAALHALLLGAAAQRPLVVVIEDLHWIDATSQAYLAALAGRIATRRVLLLTTLRPGHALPWQAQSLHAQLALAPLPDDASRALVRGAHRGAPLDAAMEARILARAQGNPFFVEALARAVTEQAGDDTAVPQTIHAVLAARIDRLPAPARRVLQAASAIGPDVPLALLRGLAGLSDAALEDALQVLQSAELLQESHGGSVGTHAFRHVLVQDVAYQSMVRPTRLELHRRIVSLLEVEGAQAGGAGHHERLAYHAQAAESWDAAESHARQAATMAFARGSNAEAVAGFEQALAANARLAQDRAARERAVDLLLALRSVLLPSGDFVRTLQCVREAERRAADLDDPARLAQAAFFLSLHLYIGGQHRGAVDAGRRAQALTALRDPQVHAIATYLVGIPLQALGRHAEAVDCFEQALAALDEVQRRQFFNLAVLPSVTCCAFLGSSLAELGRFEAAHRRAAQGLAIADSVGHPPSIMFGCWGAGWAAFRQGEAERAAPLLERALAICRESGLALHFPMVAVPLAGTWRLAGRHAEAVALLESTLERIVAHSMVNFDGVCRLFLAEALLDAGRVEAAAQAAQESLAVVRRQEERGYEAYALRVLAAIDLARGEADSALAHADQARALAEALALVPLCAQARLDGGLALAALGRRRDARQAISDALAAFESLGMAACGRTARKRLQSVL